MKESELITEYEERLAALELVTKYCSHCGRQIVCDYVPKEKEVGIFYLCKQCCEEEERLDRLATKIN